MLVMADPSHPKTLVAKKEIREKGHAKRMASQRGEKISANGKPKGIHFLCGQKGRFKTNYPNYWLRKSKVEQCFIH